MVWRELGKTATEPELENITKQVEGSDLSLLLQEKCKQLAVVFILRVSQVGIGYKQVAHASNYIEPSFTSQARKVLELLENEKLDNSNQDAVIPDIPTRLRQGFKSGIGTAFKLIIWVLPLYIVVDLLKESNLLVALGEIFSPVMAIFGLPGEAAFAFVAAFLVNLYAAIAIIVPLELTPWQVTQCGLMMGIAHNLLIEGAILRSTGVKGWVITLCRLGIAALAGLILQFVHLMGVA